MSDKKYLKGFANLGYIPVVVDAAGTYTAGSTYTAIPGAVSCSTNNNKEDFKIRADDGIWDSGAEWDDSELTIVITEMELALYAALTGSTYTNGVMEETTLDEAPVVALTFSALRADGGYRLFRYYCCKCTDIKVSHTTKGQSKDAQTYELTFDVLPRKLDNSVRGTKDVAAGDDLSWLRSVA